jgi:hypothetical protein
VGDYRNRKHVVGQRKYDETRYQNQENELLELGGYVCMKLRTARKRYVLLKYIRVLYAQFRFILFLTVGKYGHINTRVKGN